MSRVPLMPSSSDKIQITRSLMGAPYSCVVCNRSADGNIEFVDFNFSIDYYGAVYFCVPCMVPMAHAMGFVETIKLVGAEQEAIDLRSQLESTEDELTYYRTLVDTLRRVRPDLSDVDIESTKDSEQDDNGPSEPTSFARDDDNRTT